MLFSWEWWVYSEYGGGRSLQLVFSNLMLLGLVNREGMQYVPA